MVDYFETTLVPVGIKKLMKTIRTVGICTEIFVIVLVIVLGVTRRFSDLAAGILFSVLIHLLIAPVLIPGFLYDKVSQSTVCLTESRMQILDKSGNCWRTIDYRDITDVRVEKVSGFFYGRNKELYQSCYICVFLNGSTTIPDVSFAKLFSYEEFVMFAYNPDALARIQQPEQLFPSTKNRSTGWKTAVEDQGIPE